MSDFTRRGFFGLLTGFITAGVAAALPARAKRKAFHTKYLGVAGVDDDWGRGGYEPLVGGGLPLRPNERGNPSRTTTYEDVLGEEWGRSPDSGALAVLKERNRAIVKAIARANARAPRWE